MVLRCLSCPLTSLSRHAVQRFPPGSVRPVAYHSCVGNLTPQCPLPRYVPSRGDAFMDSPVMVAVAASMCGLVAVSAMIFVGLMIDFVFWRR